MVDKVSAEDLAKAFQAEEPEEVVEPQEKPLKKEQKNKIFTIYYFFDCVCDWSNLPSRWACFFGFKYN